MKFDTLVKMFADRPFFEFRELASVTPEPDSQLKNQLSKWSQKGKLQRLRREKYLLSNPYRQFIPSSYYISNYLYRPSYVSLTTALQFYGLIPEAVAMIQAVTPRHGNEWITSLGTFQYRSIKQNRFWGYREEILTDLPAQNQFLVAEPEKAILDVFYLRHGQWSQTRLQEMRFQSLETLNINKLKRYAHRFESSKVSRAATRFIELYGSAVRS